jgi:hypothetical protein
MKMQTTPAQQGDHLEVEDENEQKLNENERYLYQQLVGALMYVAVCTRPDIADAVRMVATRTSEPTMKHLTAAKRILRYLKHTKDSKLTYQRESTNQIIGYVDASWGEDRKTRKSTTGYVFCYGRGSITWKSKAQPTIALSSCEAEYTALTLAIQEAMHLLQIIQSATIPTESSNIYLLEDNMADIALATNPTTETYRYQAPLYSGDHQERKDHHQTLPNGQTTGRSTNQGNHPNEVREAKTPTPWDKPTRLHPDHGTNQQARLHIPA